MAKIKAEFTCGSCKLLRKWPITGRKADRYACGSWAWLRKRVENWAPSCGRRPRLVIRVLVWALDGTPAHEPLGRTFEADEYTDAKRYARDLVQRGIALSTDIQGRVFQAYEPDQVVEFGNYRQKGS